MHETMTAETRRVLALLSGDAIPKLHSLEPDAARALFEKMAPMLDLPPTPLEAEEDIHLAGPGGPLPARLFRPHDLPAPAPMILFLHGGGFVIGSVRAYSRLCAALAEAAKALVLSIDYRLAPEDPFPAGLEDARAALGFIREAADNLGADPEGLFIAGDSAGGNLAAVTALADGGSAIPLAGQILIYPATDMKNEHPSRRSCGEGLFLENETMRWFANHYLPDPADRGDWRASPLLAENHAGAPPALVLTAELDPLGDEGRAYAAKLAEAGVPVTAIDYPGLIHGFLSMGAVIPEAKSAIGQIADFVQSKHQHSAKVAADN
ncbi:MAG: alpha/beta hydrolase [Rhodothalassiaceae bacterium]